MKRNRLYDEYSGLESGTDFVRGFCILLMILDHALYDLAYIVINGLAERKRPASSIN